MEENNSYKKLDELIRSKTDGAEDPPSNDVWNAIEKRLDDQNKKRPGFIFWLSGIILLLTMISTILYFNQNIFVNKSNESAQKDNITLLKKNPIDVLQKQISEADNKVVENNKDTIKNKPVNTIPEKAKNVLHINITNESVKNIEAPELSKESSLPLKKKEEFKGSNTNIGKVKSIIKEKNDSSFNKTNSLSKANLVTKKNDVPIRNDEKFKDTQTHREQEKQSLKTKNVIAVSDKKDEKTEEKNNPQVAYAPNNTNRPTNVSKIDSINIHTETNNTTNETADEKGKELLIKTTVDSIIQASAKKNVPDSVFTKKDSVKTMSLASLVTPPKDTTKPKVDVPVFSKTISGYFSPDYYQNLIKDNSGQNVKDEKQKLSYSGGVKFTYMVKDKLSVRVGISYSQLQQEFNEHLIYFDRHITQPFIFHSSLGDMAVDPSVMLESFSPLAPPSITQFRFNYTYSQKLEFINIPVEAKYRFTFKHLEVSFLAGINSQYLLKQKTELDLIKENLTNILSYNNLDINKITFAGIVGLGIDIKIMKRLSLFIEPNGRINFTNLSKSNVVKSNPYFLGANAGLAIHF